MLLRFNISCKLDEEAAATTRSHFANNCSIKGKIRLYFATTKTCLAKVVWSMWQFSKVFLLLLFYFVSSLEGRSTWSLSSSDRIRSCSSLSVILLYQDIDETVKQSSVNSIEDVFHLKKHRYKLLTVEAFLLLFHLHLEVNKVNISVWSFTDTTFSTSQVSWHINSNTNARLMCCQQTFWQKTLKPTVKTLFLWNNIYFVKEILLWLKRRQKEESETAILDYILLLPNQRRKECHECIIFTRVDWLLWKQRSFRFFADVISWCIISRRTQQPGDQTVV